MKSELILRMCGLTADQVRRMNGRHVRLARVRATLNVELIVFDEEPARPPRREPHHPRNTGGVLPTAVAYGLYGSREPTVVYGGDYSCGCLA